MAVINKKWTEADVIADAIGKRSTREAAEWLNERLPEEFRITHSSVHNWVNGTYRPTYDFIYALTWWYEADDPRHQMALALHQMRKNAIESMP